jgi:hypothetical protein
VLNETLPPHPLPEEDMTKEDAQKEIDEMFAVYNRVWPYGSGLLVGSSLVGNKDGDSPRFWYLKEKFGL